MSYQRSGLPYTFPRDANGVPFLGVASSTNGVDPVVLYATAATHKLWIEDSGIIAAIQAIPGGGGGGGGAVVLGGSNANLRDDTFYNDGVTAGVGSFALRYYDGVSYNRTSAMATRLDDTTTANVTYVGKAATGTATSAAAWQMSKIDETTGMVITWADGNGLFDNVWDNRATTVNYF